jgi:hypothetical protein
MVEDGDDFRFFLNKIVREAKVRAVREIRRRPVDRGVAGSDSRTLID